MNRKIIIGLAVIAFIIPSSNFSAAPTTAIDGTFYSVKNLTGQYDSQYQFGKDMTTDHCPNGYDWRGYTLNSSSADCDHYYIDGEDIGQASMDYYGKKYLTLYDRSTKFDSELWQIYPNGDVRHVIFNSSGDSILDQTYNSSGKLLSDDFQTDKPTNDKCTSSYYSNGTTKQRTCKVNGKVDTKTFYNSKGMKTKVEDWNHGYRISTIGYNNSKVDYKWYYNSKGIVTKYEDWDGHGHRTQANTYRSGKVYGKFFYDLNAKPIKYEQWHSGRKVQINSYKNGYVTLKRYNNTNGTVNHKDYWNHGKLVKRAYYRNGKCTSIKYY